VLPQKTRARAYTFVYAGTSRDTPAFNTQPPAQQKVLAPACPTSRN